ncbi:zinc finger, PHD-type, C1-like protein [Tanacetum coccineum]
MAQNVSQKFLVPPIAKNPNTTPQKAYESQTYINFPSSGQNLPIPQNSTYSLAPSAPYEQPSHHGESGKKISKKNGIIHFSHPHSLLLVKIKHGKKMKTCSRCQETLVGKGYACSEKNCGFQLDEACFNLKKEIWHNSHPAHPLALLSSTNEYEDGMFICGACLNSNTGFTYHCSICQYDLDIKCANLKETVKRDDHEHAFKLYYECPLKEDEYTFYCDFCNEVVSQDHWTYYCQECNYGTHSDCVDREVCDDLRGDPNDEMENDEQGLDEEIENDEQGLADDMEYYRLKNLGVKISFEICSTGLCVPSTKFHCSYHNIDKVMKARLENNATVAMLYSNEGWKWLDVWLQRFPIPFCTQNMQLDANKVDIIVWVENKKRGGNFSISRVWKDFRTVGLKKKCSKVLRFSQCIPKNTLVTWLVVHERLSTQDMLSLWFPEKQMQCPLCNKEMDSHDHLFFSCDYSSNVWNALITDVKIDVQSNK